MDLWASLLSSEGDPALHVIRDGDLERWPRSRLIALAERHAATLRAHGVERRAPVACVLTNTPETCATVLGVWLAGGVVLSLPVIARGMALDTYRRQLETICALAGAEILLIERRFVEFVDQIEVAVLSYEELDGDKRLAEEPPGADEVAFVQFSSGSTRTPRGCMLSPSAIGSQLDMLQTALELDPERDRGLMWLPLSHDMGFFGGLLLLWSVGVEGLLSSPERFLASPRSWLDDCAEFRATLTIAPALALSLASRAAARQPPPSRLPLRACLVGGDVVPWETLTEAAEVLGPYGMTRSALTPAYGLAEATLGVAICPPDRPPEARAAPETGRPVVSVGPPLEGVAVRVPGDGPVGELHVRSPSLASGYLGDPAASAETFADGELATRDLGFIEDGEIHVLGRMDDVLKVGARKVWATDVEAVLESDPAVRSGSCALVDLGAGSAAQRLAIVAELATPENDLETLARRLARSARDGVGVGVAECVFLARGAMPKTPSGKLQRYRARRLAASHAPGVLRHIVLRET